MTNGSSLEQAMREEFTDEREYQLAWMLHELQNRSQYGSEVILNGAIAGLCLLIVWFLVILRYSVSEGEFYIGMLVAFLTPVILAGIFLGAKQRSYESAQLHFFRQLASPELNRLEGRLRKAKQQA